MQTSAITQATAPTTLLGQLELLLPMLSFKT